MDVFFQHLSFAFKIFYFLPAFEVEPHFEKEIGCEQLLQVGVQPNHVPMTVDRVITCRYTRHIVHTSPPSARPIGSIAPGTVQFQPFVIAAKHRKYFVQAFHITELVIIDHFAPGNQIGAGAGGVIAFEAVGTVRLYFATDKTVGMLFGIEIVQCLLERKEAGSVTGKHQNERGIPHKDISVIGGIQITGNKSGTRLGSTDIADSYFPCSPIHLQFLLVPAPNGTRQNFPGFFKALRFYCLGFCHTVLILGD